jgi:hypothetical protein
MGLDDIVAFLVIFWVVSLMTLLHGSSETRGTIRYFNPYALIAASCTLGYFEVGLRVGHVLFPFLAVTIIAHIIVRRG